jgi:hypothetical protein
MQQLLGLPSALKIIRGVTRTIRDLVVLYVAQFEWLRRL